MRTLKQWLGILREEMLYRKPPNSIRVRLSQKGVHDPAHAYKEGYFDALHEVGKLIIDTPVREFHEKFGHPIEEKPAIPDARTRMLRVSLILEEALEFAKASGVEVSFFKGNAFELRTINWKQEELPIDLEEAADALGDIRYVTDGANLAWGLPIEEILYEIHDSNMSKLGLDGKPVYREDGKVMKGPNFRLPNILKILEDREWEGK